MYCSVEGVASLMNKRASLNMQIYVIANTAGLRIQKFVWGAQMLRTSKACDNVLAKGVWGYAYPGIFKNI